MIKVVLNQIQHITLCIKPKQKRIILNDIFHNIITKITTHPIRYWQMNLVSDKNAKHKFLNFFLYRSFFWSFFRYYDCNISSLSEALSVGYPAAWSVTLSQVPQCQLRKSRSFNAHLRTWVGTTGGPPATFGPSLILQLKWNGNRIVLLVWWMFALFITGV